MLDVGLSALGLRFRETADVLTMHVNIRQCMHMQIAGRGLWKCSGGLLSKHSDQA